MYSFFMRPLFFVGLVFLPFLANLTYARDKPVLRLAMSGAFQPFSITNQNGELTGFDADMARALADRMGYSSELVQIDWAGIQAGLLAGKYDLICGSMAITNKRRESMLFSLPYYVSGAQLFSKNQLHTMKAVRLGVTEESTYASYVREHAEKFKGAQIKYLGSEAEIVAAINVGKLDAFISDRIVGGFYVKKAGGKGIIQRGDLLYSEACAISGRKDSPELMRKVNQALLSLVQDGTYSKIYQKWVGQPPRLKSLSSHWGTWADQLLANDYTGGQAGTKKEFAKNIEDMSVLLARGAALTVILAFLTWIMSFLCGLILAVFGVSKSKFLYRISKFYCLVIRGIPLLVQLFFSYFVISTLVNHSFGFEVMGAFTSALLALIVNTTAYNAETLRGGILSIDQGQWDASRALGMPEVQVMRRIILPQAIRACLPSLGNNLVVLIKDTSLVGAITLIELTYQARNIIFQTGRTIEPLLLVSLFYLAIISSVSLITGSLERDRRNEGER